MRDLRRFIDALPPKLRRQKLLVALYRSRAVHPVQLLEFNDGARAWVDLRDAESRACYISQSFWPEFPPMVAAFLRRGGDFFDVGANFGLVTFGVVPLVQHLGVGFHLFEANPGIVPLLERSSQGWPDERFAVNHSCVTDRPGTSKLTLPDSSWGHAFIGSDGAPAPNLLLDEYIVERRVQRIAFMKMDVNGWEPFALRGAARALAAGMVEAAFVEVAPDSLRAVGTSAEGLLEMMHELGFNAYFCGMWDSPDPHRLAWMRVPVNGTSLRFASASPLPSTYVQGDVMFVHRNTPLGATLRDALGSGQ
jgi:FkbM family methyltransferase